MILSPPGFVSTQVLIIGGGGAGLRAAIEARRQGAQVLLASKSRVGYGSNTAIAGGAFAAATGWRDPNDNPQVHLQDTVQGGRFLNDQRLVEVVARGVGQQVADLEECGVRFRKVGDKISVALAPGHSYPRHVYGDNRIGTDFSLPLRAAAEGAGVKFMEGVMVTRLLQEGGRVVGAVGMDLQGQLLVFAARATILACGGLGQIFLHTNNAAGTTGDGYALAYEAGLPLRDMEFVQFYPTALGEWGSRTMLYETFVFRGGARLENALGEDILERHKIKDPMLLTRDRLARAIMEEIMAGRGVEGKVIMDLTPIPQDQMAQLLPLLPREARERRRFLVAPTTHFAMGGVRIDPQGHTELKGLFACGEVCGGVHGANRLAGNALSEVFVFGQVAGGAAATYAAAAPPATTPEGEVAWERERLEQKGEGWYDVPIQEIRHRLKETMWLQVGIIRSQQSLEQALRELASLKDTLSVANADTPKEMMKHQETENMLTVAEMVARAALLRSESRGAHFRSDFPQEDNARWLKNIVIRNREGAMELTFAPVELTRVLP